MLEGKLIIIPALGHQNKGKSSFSGSGGSSVGIIMSLPSGMADFVPRDRKLQKAYLGRIHSEFLAGASNKIYS